MKAPKADAARLRRYALQEKAVEAEKARSWQRALIGLRSPAEVRDRLIELAALYAELTGHEEKAWVMLRNHAGD